MTPDQAKELRAPFAPELVGKLPRVWCKACRESRSKNCDEHRKVRCDVCKNNITSAHLHLDYVGHAEITDRLLMVDPEWTWEPVAFGQNGLPVIAEGGLWIRLTVAGVTRLGFGSADGKTGPDATKEAIGDAIRNAAMRFGVALDLWGAKFKDGEDGAHDDPEPDSHTYERAVPRSSPEEIRNRQDDQAWDPTEQETLVALLTRDIGKAKDDEELKDVGRRAVAAKGKTLSPASFDKLAKVSAARKAELNGAAA